MSNQGGRKDEIGWASASFNPLNPIMDPYKISVVLYT